MEWPTLGSRTGKEQNRTEHATKWAKLMSDKMPNNSSSIAKHDTLNQVLWNVSRKWYRTDTEWVRSNTANLFLASHTAVKPEDLLPSGAIHHHNSKYTSINSAKVHDITKSKYNSDTSVILQLWNSISYMLVSSLTKGPFNVCVNVCSSLTKSSHISTLSTGSRRSS